MYGSETWAMNAEQTGKLEQTEMRMLGCRWGVFLVTDIFKRNRLRWLGHVLWKDDGDWMKRSTLCEMDCVRGRGRLRTTWNPVVEKDTRKHELKRVDGQDLGKVEKTCLGTP